MVSKLFIATAMFFSISLGVFTPEKMIGSVIDVSEISILSASTTDMQQLETYTIQDESNIWWTCQIVIIPRGGGVTVMGTGGSANGAETYLICYETEGDNPGGKPTGEVFLHKF